MRWHFAGTYKLAQMMARKSRRRKLPYLGCLIFIGVMIYWFACFIRQDCSFLPWIWHLFLNLWRSGWVGSVKLLFFPWIHYFLFCFAVASLSLETKSENLKEHKRKLDETNPKETLGLDLVRGDMLLISNINLNENLQVLGSGILARNILQKILKADIKDERSILLFAPESKKGLLEETTYAFRSEDQENASSFFYFSLNRTDISASYSPFYGDSFNFLRAWLKLEADSREASIIYRLMTSLEKKGKPYDLDDLLVLLKDKRGAAAVNEIELTREYLWNFESLRTPRISLAEKLSKFAGKMNLEKYPIIQGFPLNFHNLLESKKHLFVELGNKESAFMMYFLTYLFYELNQKLRNYYHDISTIYFIFPEGYEELYPLEQHFTNLKLRAKLRIFSSRFSLLYSKDSHWNTIILPNIPEAECNKPEYKTLKDEITKENQRLSKQTDFKGLMSEENFDSTRLITTEMGIRTCAGLFPKYGNEGSYLESRFLYVPEGELKKMAYEPYQKKFKSEDMLHLRSRISGIKVDDNKRARSVMKIIHDLKPKQSNKNV